MIHVNYNQCQRVAKWIDDNHDRIPFNEEEVKPQPKDWTEEEIANFYLFLIAICHQTTPLVGPAYEGEVEGIHRRGWDYLSAKLIDAVEAGHNAWGCPAPVLCPSEWRKFDEKEIVKLFGPTLSDPQGRAALIKDLGDVLLEHDSMQSIHDVYKWCGGDVLTLLNWLKGFKAYRDPVEKKSIFLLATLSRNMGIWKLSDPDNDLGSPVDYHETRGHLRLGTVYVEEPFLQKKLINKWSVGEEEDIAIRSAVKQAIELIAERTNQSPSNLHDCFWHLFRNICWREKPACHWIDPETTSLPERFIPLTAWESRKHCCPFLEFCPSARKLDKYFEHNCKTDYY